MDGEVKKPFSPSRVNRNVIQSYIFSNARSRFSIVQMRILYRLVEFAQCEIEGILIKNNLCQIEHSLRHVDVTLPIVSVLPEGSKHYEQARDALKAMMNEKVEFYDPQTKTWHGSPIVYNVKLKGNRGVLEFSVADFVWDSLLDFTYGYRQFELLTILSLRSSNSMRMYSLISNVTRPQYFSFERLRQMFGLEGKYSQSADITKRLLVPCKSELDKCCPWSFDFRPMKEGRKFVGVTIFPYKIEKNADQNLIKRQLMARVPASLLAGDIYKYMRWNLGFMPKEINSNKELIDDLSLHVPDVMDILSSLKQRRYNEDGTMKGKGWIIAALKSELQNRTQLKK